MKTWVSEKGQITIPKALRDKLGIRPGCVLDFEEKNGALVGRKAEEGEDPVAAVTGIVSLEGGVDGYLDAVRGGGDG